MSELTDEQREALAGVLGQHHPGDYTHLFDDDPASTPPDRLVRCRCGWRGPGSHNAHLADALAPVVARWLAEARGEALRRVEAVDFTIRRLGTATGDPWVEGWNDALEVCRDDLRVALAAGDGDEEGL